MRLASGRSGSEQVFVLPYVCSSKQSIHEEPKGYRIGFKFETIAVGTGKNLGSDSQSKIGDKAAPAGMKWHGRTTCLENYDTSVSFFAVCLFDKGAMILTVIQPCIFI